MNYIYNQGSNPTKPTLVLLHGTGGNEFDLLPLAEQIDSEASVLSVRGNVNENGMARYFKRLRPGVFDEEDLVERTKELYDFLDEAAEEHGFDRQNSVAIGYSNGANIAGSLLFHYADAFKGAILHHPMVPIRGVSLPDLSHSAVLITAGENDPICAPEESKELYSLFQEAGADTSIHWEKNGHQLSATEVETARRWYTDQSFLSTD